MRKESIINGVVRTAKSDTNARQFQSIIEIEWMAPVPQGKTSRSLSIALQSVTVANPPVASTRIKRAIAPSTVTPPARSLMRTSAPSNAALLSMPFVVAVDQQTRSTIASRPGTSPSGPTYRIGRGLVKASGSQATLEIFSHLNNDTVITSANKFEISSGAQMRLLVGVNRN